MYTGPVAHSTPSKSSVKSLRFSDVPVTIDDGGQDMPDGAAPLPLNTSLPPTRFVFKRELSGLNNNSNNSSAVNVSGVIISGMYYSGLPALF